MSELRVNWSAMAHTSRRMAAVSSAAEYGLPILVIAEALRVVM